MCRPPPIRIADRAQLLSGLCHNLNLAVALNQTFDIFYHAVFEVLHLIQDLACLIIVHDLWIVVIHFHLRLHELGAERLQTVALGEINLALCISVLKSFLDVLQEHERQFLIHVLVRHHHDEQAVVVDVVEVKVIKLERLGRVILDLLKKLHSYHLEVARVAREVTQDDAGFLGY